MKYLQVFLLPFALSLILTPLVRLIAFKFKLVAVPSADRWHKKPIPLLGGLAIYLSFMVSALVFLPINKDLLSLIIPATLIFSIGLIDDISKLTPQAKLIGQILVSCLAVILGVAFGRLPNLLYILSIVLTIIWLTGLINGFNLLDNMDGLSCGIALICAFFLFILSFQTQNIGMLALILCASALGFLPYNFNPAKIFMGDSGSMFLGFSLAAISVMGSSRHISNLFAMLLVPILILGVPIFDTALVILLRKTRGKKVSQGGKDHTSHRLVALGLSERKTVLLLYLFSAIFGFIALSYSQLSLWFFVVLAFLAAGILLYFGMFLSEIEDRPKTDAKVWTEEKLKSNKVIINTMILHKRRILEILADFIFICVAYYLAYLLRFEAVISEENMGLIIKTLPWIIPIKLTAFYYFGLYRGVWRYVGIHDLISIFKAISVSSAAIVIILTFTERFFNHSRVVFVIDWMLLLFLIASSRIFMRFCIEHFSIVESSELNILIVGAGDKGEMLFREIKRNKNIQYKPVGFIDDNLKKVGNKIHGLKVLGTKKDLPRLIAKLNVNKVMIAIPPSFEESVNQIIKSCQEAGVEYQVIKGMLDIQ